MKNLFKRLMQWLGLAPELREFDTQGLERLFQPPPYEVRLEDLRRRRDEQIYMAVQEYQRDLFYLDHEYRVQQDNYPPSRYVEAEDFAMREGFDNNGRDPDIF